MPNPERLPKPSTLRLKSALSAAKDNESDRSSSDQGQINLSSANISASTLIHLQRTFGNHAVQRMLTPSKSQERAMSPVPSLSNDIEHSTSQDNKTIQRIIKPLEGASSGWFKKGRRDKINEMVNAYNDLEISMGGSKRSAENYESLLPEIQKIWQAAKAWQLDVMKSSPEKGAEISVWITNQVEREEDAKKASIGELKDAALLKSASDGASYNALYTTPQFTEKAQGAGINWLQTPALKPIYRYFMIQVQFDGPTLYAYDDVINYKQNPNREEAIRIYNKYDMGTTSQLNISGEGAGGVDGMRAIRSQFAALEGNPVAPVPPDFGFIEASLVKVINELFISFKTTKPYQKVTTPPPG
ncbi:MAG: hypothetical protein H0X30_38515 [Anaerolineae bacterium]|nr:hypothetical protein [Anaerolineae bacterium]